jgi:hypothetical protein
MKTTTLLQFSHVFGDTVMHVTCTKYEGAAGTTYRVSSSSTFGQAKGYTCEAFDDEALALDTANLYLTQMRQDLFDSLIIEQVVAAYPDVPVSLIEHWHKSATEYGQPISVVEFGVWKDMED